MNTNRKLALRRQSIRALTESELRVAHGDGRPPTNNTTQSATRTGTRRPTKTKLA